MQNTFIYPGAILELEFILEKTKKKNILLVTGKNSFESCGAKRKLQWLFKQYNVTHFYDFQTNPDSLDVLKGIKFFNENNCDLIISLGGGSAIDMAKLINYYQKGTSNAITEKNLINSWFEPVMHICLPTTAGSGSEATHFAVMYIADTKFSVAHAKLIPNVAIIDPELQYSQTPYQKAVSGADALAQSIESFWSVQSTGESRIYSEKALKLVWANLPDTVQRGNELSHLKVAIGAHLAGKAINIAKTTAPHALAYGFTKHAGLPHGHAVALTLPYFLNVHSQIHYENCNDNRGVEHVKMILNKVANGMNCTTDTLEKTINQYFKNINIEIDLNVLNISSETFEKATKNINYERLMNNPVKISVNTIFELLFSNLKI